MLPRKIVKKLNVVGTHCALVLQGSLEFQWTNL